MGANDLILVPNAKEYWDYIRVLRNDPMVRIGFVQRKDITVQQQIKYMEKYGNHYYIGIVNQELVGYIGEIDGDIRVVVAPEFQRKGYGSKMVSLFMELKPDSRPKILKYNLISQMMFEKLGFIRTAEDETFYYYGVRKNIA